MKPHDLARSGSEAGHQAALFAWINHAKNHGMPNAWLWSGGEPEEVSTPDDRLEWAFAVPNGGSRGGDPKSRAIQGARMKAEGVKAGVADIFMPYPMLHRVETLNQNVSYQRYHGLFIEMKKPELNHKNKSDNGCSNEQKDFLVEMFLRGYVVCVCYSWVTAAVEIQEYLDDSINCIYKNSCPISTKRELNK